MRKQLIFHLMAMIIIVVSSCSQKKSGNFVLVKGGTFINEKSDFYGKGIIIPDFYIGKYEVTQKEWKEVMGTNPSEFKGDSLPVEMVSWYDCIEYCNKRSIKEGLSPYYTINKNKKDPHNTNNLDSIKWIVTINSGANGYRLPTVAEWEYAADGGPNSMSYTYSGSNDVNEVAWYWRNSGDKYLKDNWLWSKLKNNHCRARPVGLKKPNELGLYDMSGNVREWCWDWHESTGPYDLQGRVWKGGGWIGAGYCCASSFKSSFEASGKGADQGFRVCRNK